MKLHMKHIFIFLLVLLLLFILYQRYQNEYFSNYKNCNTIDPLKITNVVNKFTDDCNCTTDEVNYCAKFGKIAVNNLFGDEKSCICLPMESGV